jgi:hypothetical protein
MDSTQHLAPCTRTQARSACILEMAAKYPWATLVDLDLLLEGWDKGEKWVRNQGGDSCLGSCTEQLASSNPETTFAEYTPAALTQQ